MSTRKELKPSTALYPTPVVLVTSIDEGGKPNIITLAWAGNICSNPPQVGISVGPPRYSNGLIRKTGEYVVNIPTADIVREADYCGMVSGRNSDKFRDTKLTAIKAKKVKPPIIAECPVSIECKVRNIIALGSHDLFVGEVVNIDVSENVLDQRGKIDFKRLKAITWNPMTGNYLSVGESLGLIGFSMKK
ncbi:MAG: flavin reductase family protein [Promethearchaeati archaeon SRVP18_Atabeyarchaeia-1]